MKALCIIDLECLHCVIKNAVNLYLGAQEEGTERNVVIDAFTQVLAELIVEFSRNKDEIGEAIESVISEMPEAVIAAVKRMPTHTPSGKPS